MTLAAAPTPARRGTSEAIVPLCGSPTARVHSHYRRTLAELPCLRMPVRLHLNTRRFFCDQRDCPQAIFTERLPDLALPYAGRTTRLAEALQLIRPRPGRRGRGPPGGPPGDARRCRHALASTGGEPASRAGDAPGVGSG
jgi:hypothetical protein